MTKILVVLVETNVSLLINEILLNSIFSASFKLNADFDFVYFGNNFPKILPSDSNFKIQQYFNVKININHISSVETSDIISEFIKQRNYEIVLIPSFPRLKFYSSLAGAVASKTGFDFVNEVFDADLQTNIINVQRPSLNGILNQKFHLPIVLGVAYFKHFCEYSFSKVEFQEVTLDELGFSEQLIDIKQYEHLAEKSYTSFSPKIIKDPSEIKNHFPDFL